MTTNIDKTIFAAYMTTLLQVLNEEPSKENAHIDKDKIRQAVNNINELAMSKDEKMIPNFIKALKNNIIADDFEEKYISFGSNTCMEDLLNIFYENIMIAYPSFLRVNELYYMFSNIKVKETSRMLKMGYRSAINKIRSLTKGQSVSYQDIFILKNYIYDLRNILEKAEDAYTNYKDMFDEHDAITSEQTDEFYEFERTFYHLDFDMMYKQIEFALVEILIGSIHLNEETNERLPLNLYFVNDLFEYEPETSKPMSSLKQMLHKLIPQFA